MERKPFARWDNVPHTDIDVSGQCTVSIRHPTLGRVTVRFHEGASCIDVVHHDSFQSKTVNGEPCPRFDFTGMGYRGELIGDTRKIERDKKPGILTILLPKG